MTIAHSTFALSALLASTAAMANLQVNFIESAPKDSFVIKNIGQCDIKDLTVKIDLDGSAGKLIFDTTAAGEGVEVFQPFEVKSGSLSLVSNNAVSDGDTSVTVLIKNLNANKSASFTIDVDDTLPKSSLGQIRVAGSEVQGAQVNISTESIETASAVFSENSSATIDLPNCL